MSGTSSNQKYGKNSKRNSPKQERAEWVGFVRCELTEIHKEDLRANPYTPMQLIEFLSTRVINGDKVSLSYDEGNSVTIASLTDRTPDSENAGLTITGRGRSPFEALQALTYKVAVILADKPWREYEYESRGEDFG